jgi:hypothetical protein
MPASSVPLEFSLLVRSFGAVTDARRARGKVHPLPSVLALVVLGLMAGQRGLADIARWATLQSPVVLETLGLRRAPSIATLWRLMLAVRVAEVREVLLGFAAQLASLRQEALTAVALDGKTLRGTWDGATQLHVLNAFAVESALALDQVAITSHLAEPVAAEAWIRAVAARFPGLTVLTGDAAYADQSLCTAIVAAQRHYLVKVKKTNLPC